MARNPRKIGAIAERIARYCFVGHTHILGVFVAPYGVRGDWQFLAPEEINAAYKWQTPR